MVFPIIKIQLPGKRNNLDLVQQLDLLVTCYAYETSDIQLHQINPNMLC